MDVSDACKHLLTSVPHEDILSLNAFYATAWKTGQYPTIAQDKAWIAARPHPAWASAWGDSLGPPDNRAYVSDESVYWADNLRRKITLLPRFTLSPQHRSSCAPVETARRLTAQLVSTDSPSRCQRARASVCRSLEMDRPQLTFVLRLHSTGTLSATISVCHFLANEIGPLTRRLPYQGLFVICGAFARASLTSHDLIFRFSLFSGHLASSLFLWVSLRAIISSAPTRCYCLLQTAMDPRIACHSGRTQTQNPSSYQAHSLLWCHREPERDSTRVKLLSRLQAHDLRSRSRPAWSRAQSCDSLSQVHRPQNNLPISMRTPWSSIAVKSCQNPETCPQGSFSDRRLSQMSMHDACFCIS